MNCCAEGYKAFVRNLADRLHSARPRNGRSILPHVSLGLDVFQCDLLDLPRTVHAGPPWTTFQARHDLQHVRTILLLLLLKLALSS